MVVKQRKLKYMFMSDQQNAAQSNTQTNNAAF